jgi:hypothetical protein
MLFDGKDWWAEGRATNGKKAKEDVQQGGVVGLEGESWIAEKNSGNLRVAVVLEEFFISVSQVLNFHCHILTPFSFCSASYAFFLRTFEFRR